MIRRYLLVGLTVAMAATLPQVMAASQPLLKPGDPIIAVSQGIRNYSEYPNNDGVKSKNYEGPWNVTDSNSATKYLNWGITNCGFIMTPYIADAIKAISFTTANDAEIRDPASYELYGTNDPITTKDNGYGTEENWELIASGELSLPSERLTMTDIIPIVNDKVYDSYKMLFPTLKDVDAVVTEKSGVQIADVMFYDAYENPLLYFMEDVLAVQSPCNSPSSHPTGLTGTPAHSIDGNPTTQYINNGGAGAGLIVTPGVGFTKLDGMILTTATNRIDCDPASFTLYGTIDYITSVDNSRGDEENWEEIASGDLNMPEARNASINVPILTDKAYRAYMVIFDTLRDPATATFMQIDEIQFTGELAEEKFGDDILSPGDPSKCFFIDRIVSTSDYPAAESANKMFDGDSGTKYLNRSPKNCGAIFTLDEAAAIRSFYFTTGNDAEGRDPIGYVLYGTNEEIVSTDNSTGLTENWIEIARGDLAFPAERQVNTDLVVIKNDTAYKSYKIIFPDTKGDPMLQIADIYLFSDEAGTQVIPTSIDTPALAVQSGWLSESILTAYKDKESAQHVVDGDTASKFCNFAIINCGIMVSPAHPLTVVRGFQITTGNDVPARDPVKYRLYGTMDALKSPEFSAGDMERWKLISEGEIELPEARTSKATFAINNDEAFSNYKFEVLSIRDITASNANCNQMSEFQLVGEILEKAPENFLTPNDFIIAVDSDMTIAPSDYPANEPPAMVLDGDSATKYLNRAGTSDSGFIVTPACGAKVLNYLQAVTANDNPARDPMTYELYGTNDEIVTQDKGHGFDENWTLLSSGELGLPETRLSFGDYLYVNNSTAYTSYKMIFTSLRDGVSQAYMQIADVFFYDDMGDFILSTDDAIVSITTKETVTSSYPVNEIPPLLIDGNILTKYLNFGKENSGVIITPSVGATTVTGFTLVAANDDPVRDPMTYELYGTNEKIVTEDNGTGLEENWTLITSGETNMDTARRRAYNFFFANETAYTSYKLVFPTIRDSENTNSMQVAELCMFEGTAPIPVTNPELSGALEGDSLVLTFVGSLEESTDGVNWTAVNTASPYTVAISEAGNKFFRATVVK